MNAVILPTTHAPDCQMLSFAKEQLTLFSCVHAESEDAGRFIVYLCGKQ